MPSLLSDAQIETTLCIFALVDESTLTPDLQYQLHQIRSHLLYTSQVTSESSNLPTFSPTTHTSDESDDNLLAVVHHSCFVQCHLI